MRRVHFYPKRAFSNCHLSQSRAISSFRYSPSALLLILLSFYVVQPRISLVTRAAQPNTSLADAQTVKTIMGARMLDVATESEDHQGYKDPLHVFVFYIYSLVFFSFSLNLVMR